MIPRYPDIAVEDLAPTTLVPFVWLLLLKVYLLIMIATKAVGGLEASPSTIFPLGRDRKADRKVWVGDPIF